MKLVCVNCRTQFRIKKNGILTVDMFQDPPEPYEAYEGDMWECPGCKTQVIAGFGTVPIAVHFEPHEMQVCISRAKLAGRCVHNYERPQVRKMEIV